MDKKVKMCGPANAVYIIQGEVSLLMTAMRRSSRWASHSNQDSDQDPLVSSFSQLRDILNTCDLDELTPNDFLGPFLEVIRSEDTTGPVTGLALSSINKFLSYALVDPENENAAPAIENIADAVTHARFVGTDPASDEVVLMKILHVLRTLMLTPAGAQLTNESVCEIMQSCFRICFEMRLSELLRKDAEHTLMDMTQLLFSRLPQFKEDAKWATNMKKLKMRAGTMDPTRKKQKKSPKPKHKRNKAPNTQSQTQTTAESTESKTLSTQPSQPERSLEEGPNAAQTAQPDTAETRQPAAPTQEETQPDPRDQPVAGEQTAKDEPPSSMLTPPESGPTSPEEPAGGTTIATTPVNPGKTVVDIHNSFRLAEPTPEEESCDTVIQIDDLDDERPAASVLSYHQEAAEDQPADTAAESQDVTTSKESLTVPGHGKADLDQQGDGDRSSCASDLADADSMHSVPEMEEPSLATDMDYINPRGVRFTPHQHDKGSGPLVPYGMPCVRELFRFLISLINPLDRHNTDVMIHMGLNLLTVALESGADHVSAFNSLLSLVKDDMCRNLFFLLQWDRLSLFAASLRVCFLLFEALRGHLKFQLEMFMTKLMELIVSESPKTSYEQRELALESVVQICRVPGLMAEMYLNYDCDLYCTCLFEDLMKLLSKNAFPVSGLFSTHLLSLEALLAVIDGIEQHCHQRVLTAARSLDTEVKSGTTGDEETTGSSGSISGPPLPPGAGFTPGRLINDHVDPSPDKGKSNRKGPKMRPNRMKVSTTVPTEEDLCAVKHKKRLYQGGTELFNTKPSKGITFLQEQGLLSTPLDPEDVSTFLKENPKLDKKMIGEYVSNKKNSKVLEAWQKSFIFSDTRVDEALRMYLETFRLPGEAPVIMYLLEHFAEHWHKSNGEPFSNVDAAFTLAYAIIMLNVDQHNHNAKKQNVPMTVDDFKRNLNKVNGGGNFDAEMLEEIFHAIKNEEIVMPAEHTGLVRENYLWKVLLKRGATKEGQFIHTATGSYDRDLFTLVWGPTVAALSFVFDKSMDDTIIQKAISGFRKCASIAAHYSLSDVFDNLVISLCKFTTLLSVSEVADNIPVQFGQNAKAQLAAKTVFALAHRHGDILREGWKNILDCILQLYRAKLLPELLVTVEDFLDPHGRISLIKEDTSAQQKTDTGVFSSFYSYFSLSEPAQQKAPSPEEQEASRQAQLCIEECHLEQLVTESKFLTDVSLHELLKALMHASQPGSCHEQLECQHEEDACVFYLELLIKVALQNRDRLSPFWEGIRDHMYQLIVHTNEHTFLVERAVVGLLRLAIRLMRREEIAPQVLASLKILLMMKSKVVHNVCRHISFALHELLRTNAANIHLAQDWLVLFTLLEVVGAGTNPPTFMQSTQTGADTASDSGAQSDSDLPGSPSDHESGDRGYTSDSELYESQNRHPKPSVEISATMDVNSGSWLVINKEEVGNERKNSHGTNQYNIVLNEEFRHHDTKSLMKTCETLAFLVRDAAHITPHNFESCVHCIRTFVEASINGGHHVKKARQQQALREKRSRKERRMKKSRSSPSHLGEEGESEEEREADGYHSLSIQLLDLMHTLHTRAASIFSSWAAEERKRMKGETYSSERIMSAEAGTLWIKCWCPLLQGIARLCCDTRRQVRSQALTYLQRALLVHDLQTLSAVEWESCFNKVLFPLLSKLLENINPADPTGIEETRMRASTLLCKVFLQHLSPLMSLSTFTALWLTILDFMDRYMHADKSDLLNEAVPESLKNMLLVMHTAGILNPQAVDSQLWKMTWHRIDTFLPTLRKDVFKPHEMAEPKRHVMREVPAQEAAPEAASAPEQPQVNGETRAAPTPPPAHSAKDSSTDTPPQSDQSRPDSPHTSQTGVAGQYILHPPLPSAASPTVMTTTQPVSTVPLLLNPDIIHGTNIPIISPQKKVEAPPQTEPVQKEPVVVEDI